MASRIGYSVNDASLMNVMIDEISVDVAAEAANEDASIAIEDRL